MLPVDGNQKSGEHQFDIFTTLHRCQVPDFFHPQEVSFKGVYHSFFDLPSPRHPKRSFFWTLKNITNKKTSSGVLDVCFGAFAVLTFFFASQELLTLRVEPMIIFKWHQEGVIWQVQDVLVVAVTEVSKRTARFMVN